MPNSGDRTSQYLVLAGVLIVIVASQFGGALRYQAILMSFGILVFLLGATILSLERKTNGVYIKYMWGAGLVIIASLTGASVLGAILGPIFKP